MKRSGLERHRWIDPIDEFVRQHGRERPCWAIFLTYQIGLERLARNVLPCLARRGRRFRSVVLADHGTLEECLRASRPHLPGAVNLHPVRCLGGGVFHPKLAFLRAGAHVRACFGSANVTDGGLGTNLEMWTWSESAEVLCGIQHFLYGLVENEHVLIDDGARRSVRRALAGLAVDRPTPLVWSSLEEPFAKRLKNGPERRARSATIVSPMYAGEGGIKFARAAIPVANVELFTGLAVAVPSAQVFEYAPPHPADQADEDPENFQSTLHAKLYSFDVPGNRASLAWVGSANFTAQALTKDVAHGGNVELMVRTELPLDESRALADDLDHLFRRPEKLVSIDKLEASAPSRSIATILSCELIGAGDSARLVIHATIRRGVVILVGENGVRVRVAITRSRGVLDGVKLRVLIPNYDPAIARALVILQLVGGEQVPVVVNVPHVPPESGAGDGHLSLDVLLDDWLGRIKVPPAPTDGDDTIEPDDEDTEIDEDDGDDVEKKLDEVKHQGELDQFAVKAALLKKLAKHVAPEGAMREGLLSEAYRALLAASPRHLVPSIKALFRGIA